MLGKLDNPEIPLIVITEHKPVLERYIDNEMEVNLRVNKLSALGGDIDSFLRVIPGKNTIEIDGTGIDVTVTIDFTPMWL